MSYPNLGAMHRDVADRLGPRTALRFRQNGLYHDLTWDEYRRHADEAAAALINLGIGPGDRVGLLSENRHEWLEADIACLSAGAVDVPLHAPLSPAQVEYQLAHSGAKGVFVGDRAQAEKVLSVLDNLPALQFLVAFDPIGIPPTDRLRVLSWEGLKQTGRRLGAEGARSVLDREAGPTRDDLATIIYTSGTTGLPKGVMLSHGNLLSNVEGSLAASALGLEDVHVAWLPLSHVYARTCDHYQSILAGETLCMAESLATLLVDIEQARPTWMTAVPRFYEKVWSAVEHLPPDVRAQALKRTFGPRLRQLSSGGAPLPKSIAEGYQAAGIPLLEGYGLTESSPVISFNSLVASKLGTVGRAIPGVEIRIADDGEILTRGPHVMMGYWNDPEGTRAAIVDGWLLTGDVGRLDDEGFLTITDRKKDLIVTSVGKNVVPAELERLLGSDPCIDQAVVHGDRRPFITALIVPNLALLTAKAEELGIPLEVEDEEIRGEGIRTFMAERIDRLMMAVSQPERVKAFVLLARPFQLEAEELTATLKVRRRHLIAKHADRLDALYADER